MGILIPLIIVLVACLIIWRACDGFETASEYLGRDLSEGVRGGTINAISSSIPELLTTLIALFVLADRDGFAVGIGTTAGSALFNGMIIPAACILFVVGRVVAGRRVRTIEVSVKVLLRDCVALLVAQVLLIVVLQGTELLWWHGLVLMLTYVAYLVYMVKSMKAAPAAAGGKGTEASEVPDEGPGGGLLYWMSLGPLLDLERLLIRPRHRRQIPQGDWNAWPLLLVSTAVMGVACTLLVKACEWLGTGSERHPGYEFLGMELSGLGIPPLFVAVIFASMATSVPDTVISVRDARDGDHDDAVANAVGSNVFDICFALGFPLFLYTLVSGPIELSPETMELSCELRVSLLLLSLVGVGIYLFGRWRAGDGGPRVVGMGTGKAVLLLGLYVVFVVYVVGRSTDATWVQPIAEALRALADRAPRLR